MKKIYSIMASTAIALTLALSQSQAASADNNMEDAGIEEAKQLYGQALPMKMDSLKRAELLGQATDILKKVIENNPKSMDAHRKLMGIQLLQQDYANGIRTIQDLITLSPGDPKLFISLAFMYEHSGALEFAEEMLDQALTLKPEETIATMAKDYRASIKKKIEKAQNRHMDMLHSGSIPMGEEHGQLKPGADANAH